MAPEHGTDIGMLIKIGISAKFYTIGTKNIYIIQSIYQNGIWKTLSDMANNI